jgi:hypothetical protein
MYVLLAHVPYLAFQACMALAGLFGYSSMAGLACKVAHHGDSRSTTLGLDRAQDWASDSEQRRRLFTDEELQR